MTSLHAGAITVDVAPRAGGRLASVVVAGTELLVTAAAVGADTDHIGDAVSMMQWGSFPMAPWAGRVRRGRFTHDGVEHTLPLDLPPHAIHGTTYRRPWSVESHDATTLLMRTDLDWPLGGWATQRLTVDDDSLTCILEVTAGDRSMPAQVGWHPWFRRPTHTTLRFSAMYARDADGIPTGDLVPPGPAGSLDDCFVDPLGAMTLVVPGRRGGPDVEVEITSDCRHVVVYDRPDHAICVEPQSGPPDGFTLEPLVLGPGETLGRWMRWRVRPLSA